MFADSGATGVTFFKRMNQLNVLTHSFVLFCQANNIALDLTHPVPLTILKFGELQIKYMTYPVLSVCFSATRDDFGGSRSTCR